MTGKKILLVIGYSLLVIGLTGCAVRTYTERKDRVDQELSGNRGYLLGSRPAGEEKERPASRQVYVTEIEIGSKAKAQRKAPQGQPATDEEIWGNRGYIEEKAVSPVEEVAFREEKPVSTESYTVQKNDTLQKISQKFYGTTKKWHKIFEFNKDILKSPDKIYPGQVINIPLEGSSLKEPQENLK